MIECDMLNDRINHAQWKNLTCSMLELDMRSDSTGLTSIDEDRTLNVAVGRLGLSGCNTIQHGYTQHMLH